MARPLKEIDQVQFEKLCALQCTRDEICEWFGVTDKTLTGWCKRTYGENFSAIYEKKRSPGRISIRRAQFKLAEKNATMAIWLGKQYLGQADYARAVDAQTMEDDPLTKALKEEAGKRGPV